MLKEQSLMEQISSRVTELGELCREVPFEEGPLLGTGLGAIYDTLLVFSDKQDEPGAVIVFEPDALISYVQFEEDAEDTEIARMERAIELGQRISESCVSISTVIESN